MKMKRGRYLWQRREEAAERQAVRDARSDKDQIRHLESKGHGHCREVTRLRARIAKKAS